MVYMCVCRLGSLPVLFICGQWDDIRRRGGYDETAEVERKDKKELSEKKEEQEEKREKRRKENVFRGVN